MKKKLRNCGMVLGCVSLMSVAGFSQPLGALQDNFLTLKYGAFLHFNMGTFTDEEWATPGQNPDLFNPAGLDCGQWADVARDAGMKYLTLTTKHHDGFCLWNSAYQSYNVGSSSWRDGGGDAVREFVDSTRSRGLKVCFYYSIWDKTSGSDTTFIKNQLTELLTDYGPVTGIWFDGWGWKIGYTAVPFETIRNHVKSLQPACLVMENNHRKSLSNTEIMLYERNIDGLPPADNTVPLEVCCNIRSDGNWFYHATGNCDLRSVDYLYTSLSRINQGHGNYLLDLTPDRTGRIPQCQADRLQELVTYRPDTTLLNQNFADYYGTWKLASNRTFGDYFDDVQFTQTAGDSFVFFFTGTGVDFITELNADHGSFAMYLDGVFQDTADCSAPADQRTAQQVLFTATGLVNGPHRLKGVYLSSGTEWYGVVDAFRVYPDTSMSHVASRGGVPAIPHNGAIAFSGQSFCLGAAAGGGHFSIYSATGRNIADAGADRDGVIRLPHVLPGVYFMRSRDSEDGVLTRVVVLP